jgi:hypothetical protein
VSKRIVFDQVGTFAALYAAQDWCKANGVSYGSSQSGAPTGLMRGKVIISKWRNLSNAERADLDGTMTGDMRNGPITIEIKDTTHDSQ